MATNGTRVLQLHTHLKVSLLILLSFPLPVSSATFMALALANSFLLPTKTHLALHVSPPPSKKTLLSTNPSSNFNLNKALSSRRSKQAWCVAAAADIKDATLLDGEEDQKVLVGPSSEQERKGEREVADYDWTEEWYPLYLTKNVPHDAPLGLKVYDKNIVLFRDGNDQFQCYEDRCPHRLVIVSLTSNVWFYCFITFLEVKLKEHKLIQCDCLIMRFILMCFGIGYWFS